VIFHATTRRRRNQTTFDILAILLGGAWTLWPFILHRGIPGYQHDWSWPFFSSRACAAIGTIGSTWLTGGLGHPNPFANENPIAIAIAVASCRVLPAIALRLYLLVVILVAGTGMLALSRSMGIRGKAAAVAAFFYLAAPPFFNKVTAGQIGFFAAIALLPWVVVIVMAIVTRPSVENVLVAAILMSLTFVQPQFIVFNAAIIVAFLLFHFKTLKRAIFPAIASYGLAVGLSAPFFYAAMFMRPDFRYTVPKPLLAWEWNESGNWLSALRLNGYISPYSKLAYMRMDGWGVFELCLTLVCAVGAFGLLRSQSPSARAIAAIGALAYLIMTGLKGPLAIFFHWGFLHVQAFTLIRELYDAAPLLAVAYSVGLAMVVDNFRKLNILIWGMTIIALLPLMAVGHDRDLHFIIPSRDTRIAMRYVASGAPSRFLPLPYKMPIAYGRKTDLSGVDTLAFVNSARPSASTYGATVELDQLAGMLGDGRKAAVSRLLTSFGIGHLVIRPNMLSAFPAQLVTGSEGRSEGRARVVFSRLAMWYEIAPISSLRCAGVDCVLALRADPAAIVSSARVAGVLTNWRNVTEGAPHIDSGTAGRLSIRFPSADVSPYDGWVDASMWGWDSSVWDEMPGLVTVTKRGGQVALSAHPQAFLSYVAQYPLELCVRRGTCRRLRASSQPRRIDLVGNAVIRAMGWAAIARIGNPVAAPSLRRLELSHAREIHPWEYVVEATGHGLGFIEFKSRFNPDWILLGARSTHVRADAYANGWIVRLDGTSLLTIYFQPQHGFDFVAAAAGFGYVSVLLLLAVVRLSSSLRRKST